MTNDEAMLLRACSIVVGDRVRCVQSLVDRLSAVELEVTRFDPRSPTHKKEAARALILRAALSAITYVPASNIRPFDLDRIAMMRAAVRNILDFLEKPQK